MFKELIGKRLRAAREEAGFTQYDIAKKINSTYQKISSFETGRTRVDIETLVRLCDIYQINPNDILMVSENNVQRSEPEKEKLIAKINRLNEDGCKLLSLHADGLLANEEFTRSRLGERERLA